MNEPSNDPQTDPFATQSGEISTPDPGLASLDTVGDLTPVHANAPDRTGDSRLRFRILRAHAKGGLGQVLVAQDTELRRQVAVKEIQSQYADMDESQNRFIFEAEVTGRLEHPGIVPVYALGRYEDGRPYYAMRFITGTAMSVAIDKLHACDDPEQAHRQLRDLLQRFVTVCNTIEFAHSRGYLHRDLKPANIMLGEYAETLVVDWGLAKQIGSNASHFGNQDVSTTEQSVVPPSFVVPSSFDIDLDAALNADTDAGNQADGEVDEHATMVNSAATPKNTPTPKNDSHGREGARTRVGRIVGTPQYMAPEQATGNIARVGPQSDVYSLGATLYQILTGRAPLSSEKKISINELLQRVAAGDIPATVEINPRVPKPLDAICRHAMRRDLDDRYQSARDLARDIENYLADDPISVVPETALRRAGRWTRKHRGVTATIGGAIIAIAMVSTAFYGVTQTALNRTERYLAISQLQQQFDTQISVEERRLNQPAIAADQIPIADELIDQGRELIQQIESLQSVEQPGFVDRNRRFALLQTWTSSLDKLNRQRLSRELQETLVAEVGRLREHFPFPDEVSFDSEVNRLEAVAKERIGQWYRLERPALTPDRFSLVDNGQADDHVFLLKNGESNEVLLADTPAGNVQFSARFAGDWTDARVIGLVINATDDSGYRFLIADQDYHPVYGADTLPTIPQSDRLGRLCAMIVRGDDILRVQPIKLGPSPEKLTVRRERGTLLTLVYGDAQIRFEDLFPLSPEVPGKIGVVGAPGVTLADLELETQRDTKSGSLIADLPELDAIDIGDRAFAEGDWVAAREAYERLPDDVEALAKRALVLEYLDPDAYENALRAIIRDHAPEGVQAPRDRQWYLYAGVRLFLHYLDQDDQQEPATSVLSRLNVNYSLEDVQALIPESQRQRFSQALLKPGKRTRVLFDNQGEIESLDGVIELFSNNPQWRRLAYWRKADTIRYDWDRSPQECRDEARVILDRLINEIESDRDADELTVVTLVGDRIWLDILDANFENGHALLQRFLPEPGVPIPSARLPLLIERARLLIAQADQLADDVQDTARKEWLDQAHEDLITFTSRVDPADPPEGIHYTHFGNACAILGLVDQRRGNEESATQWYQRGRRRNWGPYVFDTQRIITARGAEMILETETPEPFLAARTDGYRGDEWKEIADELLAGSGLNDFAIRNLIFNSEQLPDEWIELVAEKVFSGPRGRKISDQSLLHQIPLKDTNKQGVALILYQAVLHLTLGGEEALVRYPELDEMLFERCERLIRAYENGKFQTNEMAFILAAFTGSWNDRSFSSLKESLGDDDLAAGLGMIFALIQLVKENDFDKFSAIVEKHLRPHAAELPSLYLQICDDKTAGYREQSK
ncbi:serine/threonine-protein kinase [Neorhodopirellula pilleata]|uniref:Serine/threonine-protein kinase PknD n=1 Tax=Neorhodopirellula pilleata TaxID=2714738 RepID=A0A5C6AUD7_9BACT|nr:serine/threonine-protein kinase [Neorhodopirellula pilleata]TWU03087.1 Serine/threonine-protein kinase PknD [Neorhodopirellula pilleata]